MARRNDTQKYLENPFIAEMAESLKIGVKPLYIKEKGDGEQLLIVSQNDGEIKTQGGIFARKQVDKAEFLKLYTDGVSAILGLDSSGKHVFRLLYSKLAGANGIGKTEIVLNYDELAKEAERKKEKFISATTFYRGIKNLIKNEILADSLVTNKYFINPKFIFNGDRLTIANEYYLKQDRKLIESAKKLRQSRKE